MRTEDTQDLVESILPFEGLLKNPLPPLGKLPLPFISPIPIHELKMIVVALEALETTQPKKLF